MKNEFATQVSSRFSYSAIKNQVFKTWRSIAFGLGLSLAGAVITVLVATLTGNPIWKLVKDPAEVMGFSAYIGMLSNWGVLLWISAAAICLFGAIILKQHKAAAATIRFITISGALSLTLGVDDLYRFHDRILPKLFHVREDLFYILYFLVLLVYLVYFLPEILKYDFLILGIALVLLGMARQSFFIKLGPLARLMPLSDSDMLKYFGIVFWAVFFYRTSLQEVNALFRPKET